MFVAVFTTLLAKLSSLGCAWTPVAVASCPRDLMENLESSFTIEINGRPISSISDNSEQPAQAKVGTEPAVFKLTHGRLQCGDRFLGRAVTENRSMLPKQVFWFDANAGEDKVKPVTAEVDGDSYKLIFSGAPLAETDGAVFADLMNEGSSKVVVKMQQ